jgi:hypothetical protein
MSTRSAIIIEENDGTAKGIYCHSDGYPEHHKPILLKHYESEAKVRELIALGSLSVLGTVLGKAHDFEERGMRDECTAYHRDRGEELRIATGRTWAKVATQIDHEHVYVFRCGPGRRAGHMWYYTTNNATRLTKLGSVQIEKWQ